MPNIISLQLQPKQTANLKQHQLFMMLPKMRQAIQLLQLPLMELAPLIEEEMERNPVLECNPENYDEEEDSLHEEPQEEASPEKPIAFDDQNLQIFKQLDDDFNRHFAESGSSYLPKEQETDYKSFLENTLCTPKTLFSHLMEQAKSTFDQPEDLQAAEAIIGNIDSQGYLTTPLEEIAAITGVKKMQLRKLLQEIQTFDPYGVGAESIQQSLLIQLRLHNKKNTLAYTLIEKHYDDLLHNRIPKIQKRIRVSYQEIREAIDRVIAKLDLHPGSWYAPLTAAEITPDAHIRFEDETIIVEVNDETLPPIQLNRHYVDMLDDDTVPDETKNFIREQILSAKWLARNIYQRSETIFQVVQYIAEKQKDFFLSEKGELVPLTMKEVAEKLNVHESTVARTVANKYVNTPEGLFPIRFFFSHAYNTAEGENISSRTVKEAIRAIIQSEDKQAPFSDEQISVKLREQGVICARRTVAKHRNSLGFGNTKQRRLFAD